MPKKFDHANNMIPSFDLTLWSLVQHILFKWHTQVIFTWEVDNVREQRRGCLNFFIPGDSTYAYEIQKFLEEELKDERQEDTETEGTIIPGTDINIAVNTSFFSGLSVYIGKKDMEDIMKEFYQQLSMREKRSEKEQRDEEEDE